MANLLTLTHGRKSGYVIVIPSCPSPSEETAARELKSYIERISGATLKILKDSCPPREYEISVGQTNRVCGVDTESLGDEGFVIQTKGEQVFIVGGKLRGTLYGVYTFLEEYLGCRFYTSDCEKIPENENISLTEINIRQVPVFEFRDMDWTQYQNPMISVKRKLNGHFTQVPKNYGGTFDYAGQFCHTFQKLCPPDVYFEEHPEYFSLGEDGQRNTYQLCLTNPDTLRICIDTARDWLRKSPSARIISITQNDGGNPCMCENCRKIYEREGTYSGAMIEFVNKIAEELEPEFPNVMFDTFAYQYTREKPKHIVPRENVVIRLCSIECCFNHPQEECHEVCYIPGDSAISTQSFYQDLLDWSSISKHLYIWDYTCNFSNWQATFPNFRVMLKNVKTYADHNVVGVFEEGNRVDSGEFGELRPYLISKILWNPYMSEEEYYAHMNDFLDGYYGPGGIFIRQYIDCFQNYVKDKHVSTFYKLTTDKYGYDVIDYPEVTRHTEKPSLLTIEMILDYENTDWSQYLFWYKDVDCSFVTEGLQLFDKAMALAENDVQRARIARSRCQVVYHDAYYQRVRQKHIAANIMQILKDVFAEDTALSGEQKEQLLQTVPSYVETVFYGKKLREVNMALYDTLAENKVFSVRVETEFLSREEANFDVEPMDMMKRENDKEAI